MSESADIEAIKRSVLKIEKLKAEMNTVLFGKEELIENVLTGIIAGGHILLEGLPGLGKTELVKALSKTLGLQDSRIQFTPDLLPGDITGNPMLQEKDGHREFVFQPGPVFSNFVLADEINRASPKTQSSLLEAMQERRVTVMGETHELPKPFFVLATQNPIELEGTYTLPEAQVDRFLFKLTVGKNSVETLQKIVSGRRLGEVPQVTEVIQREELLELIKLAQDIFIPDVVANYIARLVDATHPGTLELNKNVRFGASPRAALSLAAGGKARALMKSRNHVSYEDIDDILLPVLQHRIIMNYSGAMDGETSDDVIEKLLSEIPKRSRDLPSTLKSD